MAKKKKESLSGAAAELSFLAGLNILHRQFNGIDATGAKIESNLNEAALLSLFSRDRSTLSVQEIEVITAAANGILEYAKQLQQAQETLIALSIEPRNNHQK